MKTIHRNLLVIIVCLGLTGTAWAQTATITGSPTMNTCEEQEYTVTLNNTSGNPLTNVVVANNLALLTGSSYVPGSSSIWVDSNSPFCNLDPSIAGGTLTWNIDTLCSTIFTLNNGQQLHIKFRLRTSCTSVSASMNAHLTYNIGGTPSFTDTAYSVEVLPGGITIKKTPAVIPAEVGQTVTWTITVENSGLGLIKNVKVTDLLGAGLRYASSTPSGINAGQTTTWDTTQVPEFASMIPGQKVTIDITVDVIACVNLDNKADARWGCDGTTDCFNTATNGGTATASVQRLVKNPNLQFTPPDITFSYCNDSSANALTINNVGDGTAHDVRLMVDFSPLTVVASSVPYNPGGYFEIGDIAAGGHYDLTFTLQYATWCGGPDIAKNLIWIPVYKDDCDNEFFPPIQLSRINPVTGGTGLSVTKTGAPAVIHIGDVITYTITSAYTGPVNCGSGSVGTITVVDTIPPGFIVTDAGGGTYVPGGGGTGGTITWTYTPPASLSRTITLQSPTIASCETYCNTTFTNSIIASGVDCCGCTLNASDSQTTAIECAEGVTSNKIATGPTERCDDITYTNTYVFDGDSSVNLNNLIFTEHAEHEQLYNNNLSITLDGADITASAVVTDTTAGVNGMLVLDFSGAPATSLAGKKLTISYNLTATEDTVAACGASTFYSWSSLNMGASGSSCLGDGVIHETTPVTIGSPSMSTSLTGLGQLLSTCQTQAVTLTLTQTSTFDPKDVKLVLSGLNYYVVDHTNPAAITCSGAVAPVSCVPTLVGDDYVWTFNDLFTGQNQSATIVMNVQKRCTGPGDLVARGYFDDKCTDDATSDELCSTTATVAPAILTSADLLIEKTPEVIYAATNSVQWVIYLTNRGTGKAYNVWVDDVLGAGLVFDSATVSPDSGDVTITANQDHNGGPINGATIAIAQIAAGQRRMITLNAHLIACTDLTNVASASWGCVGVDCQTVVTDSSTVELPAPLLVVTPFVTTPINACSDNEGRIIVRNAGQVTVYNEQITETLATGLVYVLGTTRWRLYHGGAWGAWNGPNAAYDPNPTISPLVWTKTQIPALSSLDPGDSIEIEYDLHAHCPFTGGTVTVSTQYENPCGQVFTVADSNFTVVLNAPNLRITKTRINEPIGCATPVTWTIQVQNLGTYVLPIVWVEDSMSLAYTYVSSTGDVTYSADSGTGSGQHAQWELRNLAPAATATLTLTATSDSGLSCQTNLDNTVSAWWGCGAADGSSTTKPGVNAPDNTLCLSTSAVTATRSETRQPTVSFTGLTMGPLNTSGIAEITVVVNNTGPTDAHDLDLRITMPAGLTHVAGSSLLWVGVDDTGVPATIVDPTIGGNVATFYDIADRGTNLANLLQATDGITNINNDTLVLKFSVQASCYTTASMGFDLYYFDCCSDTQYHLAGPQPITALYPNLVVTKTPVNSQVACGAPQTWTITVTNNGTAPAEVVRIEDTPGAWITVDTVNSTPTPTSMPGGVYGWEINNLSNVAPNNVYTITLIGTLNPTNYPNQNSCTVGLRRNNVRAIWGSGTNGESTDGDPNTQGYACTFSTWSAAPVATLQMPNLVVQSVTPVITFQGGGTASGTVTVRVRNNGNGTAYGPFSIAVTEDHDLTWTGVATYAGNLAAGAFVDLVVSTLVPTVWNPNCFPCTLNFHATVDSLLQVCECNETDNTGTGSTPGIDLADLLVTKLAAPSPVLAGNDITYAVTVTNLGPNDARTVQLVDAIPANTTFVSTTVPGGWTRTDGVVVGGTGTLTFTTPLLVKNSPVGFTIVVRVNPNVAGGTNIANSATASTATPEPLPDPNPDTGTTTTPVTTLADLLVTKSVTGTGVAGTNLTYTVGIQNLGPSDALTVVLTDATPTNTTFVSTTTPAGWTRTDAVPVGGTGVLNFTTPTLAALTTATFTIVVRIDANTPSGTNVVNTATATTATPEPNPDPNPDTATVTTPSTAQADLWVRKSVTGSGNAGDNLTYTVLVSNEGPSDAQTVVLNDPTPLHTTLVSVTTPAGWTRTDTVAVGGTGALSFSIPTLAALTSATFTIVVNVDANTPSGTNIVNTATVTTTTPEPNPDPHPDTGTVTTPSTVLADLWVQKSVTGSGNAGDNLTYTILVSNEGPSDAQSVVFTDPTPTHTTFVSVNTPAGWTRTDATPVGGTGTLRFTIPSFAALASNTFTIVVRIDANTPPGTSIANTATATTATPEPNPDPHADTDTVTTPSTALADLMVTKTGSPPIANVGSTITYTVVLRNFGPSDAQDVVLTDPIPVRTTFVSTTTPPGWTRTDTVAAGGTGTLRFTLPTLVAGGSATFTIILRVDENAALTPPISNIATATTTTPEPNPDPHPDTDTAATTLADPIPLLGGVGLVALIALIALAGALILVGRKMVG